MKSKSTTTRVNGRWWRWIGCSASRARATRSANNSRWGRRWIESASPLAYSGVRLILEGFVARFANNIDASDPHMVPRRARGGVFSFGDEHLVFAGGVL